MKFKIILMSITIVMQCLFISACLNEKEKTEEMIRLRLWDRGVKVESRHEPSGFAYLWFYEWHLFDAVKSGEHTPGTSSWKWQVDSSGVLAQMDSEWLKLKLEATVDGADMVLDITNISDHDWPEIAAIIPCFNPGADSRKNTNVIANPVFFDESHTNTYFLGKSGFELIKGQEYPRVIHFNHKYRSSIMAWHKERDDDQFVFNYKWPTSERNAHAGLIIRESDDNKWVMGVAWQSYLSVQGHNPWKCMHLSVRVGPLKRGEKKTIRGKIYLFKGSKENLLNRYREDFSHH
jgi:hypothetical protein